MGPMLQPVILRVIVYALSSLLMLAPSWLAGIVTLNPATNAVTLSFGAAAAVIAAAVVANLGIAARWGVKVAPDQVAGLITRLALYASAPAIAALPGWAVGLVTVNSAAGTLTISLAGLSAIAAASIGGGGAIFKAFAPK